MGEGKGGGGMGRGGKNGRGGKGRMGDELGKLQLSRQETYWRYSSTCVSNLIHNVLGPVVNRPMHFGGVPEVCVNDEPVYTCRGLTAVCVCWGGGGRGGGGGGAVGERSTGAQGNSIYPNLPD